MTSHPFPLFTPVHGHLEIVKILAPLAENPNTPDSEGLTPIHWAAIKGYLEIIKTLAPLSDNPNAPDNNGITPINLAAWNEMTEINNYLVLISLTKLIQ